MQIKEAMRKGMIKLKTNDVKEPNLKARLLMQYILNRPREYILVHDDKQLTLRQNVDYFKLIKKLIEGVPLQHITHQQEFMKLMFYVDEVIKLAKNINAKKILDLCTGSGAIAVSLAKYIEGSQITATDISRKALSIAKLNATNNNVEDKITFVSSDLFQNISEEKYDIIVSNPPYIKRKVIKTLDEEVKREPIIALDGGNDGLDFYKKIIGNAYQYLKYKGYLCLEIGYDQKDEVIDLINKEEKYIDTYSKKDLFDNDRIVITKLGMLTNLMDES